MAEKPRRKDKRRMVLRKGESQRKDGSYDYRWTTRDGKRHSIYAKTLEELREKEEEVANDQYEGIRVEGKTVTVNDIFEMWCNLKRGLKDNTFQNYKYTYNLHVKPVFGRLLIKNVRKSDVKRFYNSLADDKNLSVNTIDGVHTVLHQVFDLALDDNYIRSNPCDNVLRELKQSHVFKIEKRRGLTRQEQDLFLNFLKNSEKYRHWYPVFAIMVGTGLRVGELTGLRWCDIDLDEGLIDVNHTLVYYKHEVNGCYFSVNTPKTEAGRRTVPMLEFVKEAFMEEKRYQEENGIVCVSKVDGYTDFIFVNRFGMVQHQATLNKAIRRITRDCNDAELLNNPNTEILLPHFSCHSLRHTFTTRMCEAGVNVKVIQDTLGHADISTTLNIYADVTKDLKKSEFEGLDNWFNKPMNQNDTGNDPTEK